MTDHSGCGETSFAEGRCPQSPPPDIWLRTIQGVSKTNALAPIRYVVQYHISVKQVCPDHKTYYR